MELLITELKQAREAKGISLSDIADATLINLRFLEELERGNFAFLPQTYVRAFLREYALQVDLNPEDVTRMYDDTRKVPPQTREHKHPKSPPPLPVEQPSPPPASPPDLPTTVSDARIRVGPVAGTIVLGSVLAIGIAVAIWNLAAGDGGRAVEEIPFESVIKEHEIQDTPSVPPSSLTPSENPGFADSLVLQATTTDTVWIQLVTDGGAPKDYMVRPNVKRTWKARENFDVTVGNASSVEFRLNNIPLGKLGKPGAVVRNVQLNRSTLKK